MSAPSRVLAATAGGVLAGCLLTIASAPISAETATTMTEGGSTIKNSAGVNV